MTPPPFGLLAELTHRCPLRCPYCSNPLDLAARDQELPPETWERVMREAGALGVVQTGISGGEPLAYPGVERVVAAARSAGIYTNLITSGVSLTRGRADALAAAGLEAAQISLQADEAGLADRVAGAAAHRAKLAACAAVRDAGIALGINFVLHRATAHLVAPVVRLAESLGAIRIEIANVQFVGWASENVGALLPTRAQVAAAAAAAEAEAGRLRGRMQVVYVLPDFYSERPKPCLHGWGRHGIAINPRGDAMPCQAAGCIPGLAFDNVRDRPLADIWASSPAFDRFRGTAWMKPPCATCEFREADFGGCRCHAALFAGDPTAADPVCSLSPHRPAIDALVAAANASENPHDPRDRQQRAWTYRAAAPREHANASAAKHP